MRVVVPTEVMKPQKSSFDLLKSFLSCKFWVERMRKKIFLICNARNRFSKYFSLQSPIFVKKSHKWQRPHTFRTKAPSQEPYLVEQQHNTRRREKQRIWRRNEI